jgi:hypothetical protein
MGALFAHADTSVVFDKGNLRVSLFSPEGEFVRSFRIPTELGLLKGVFGDGSFLLGSVPGVPALPEPGFHRPRRTTLHLDREGRILDTLGAFPDFEHVVRDIPVSPGRGMRVSAPPPFGRETRFAASGGVFAVGDQTEAIIPVLGMAGDPRLTIRWTAEDRLVTEAAKAWYREQELRESRDDRERFATEKRLAVEVFPDSVPPYRSLLFDKAGRLWVEAYRVPPGERVPWRVFDEDGRPLGRAEVPGDLTVLEIGPGYLLGKSRDELGVESLRVFRLSDPTGGEHGDGRDTEESKTGG